MAPPVSLFGAFARALGQIGDPALRAPLLKSVALSIATCIVLWIGLGYVLTHSAFFAVAWLDWSLGALGSLGVILLTIILFPTFVAAFLGLFLEAVVVAVERRYYPDLPPPATRGVVREIFAGLQLVALALAVNLAVLPLYLVPGLNIAVFLAANGFLLAREYVTMCLLRRVDSDTAKRVWRHHRGEAWLAGAGFAALSMVPIVNLFAPVLAVAATTHLIENWRRLGTESALRG